MNPNVAPEASNPEALIEAGEYEQSKQQRRRLLPRALLVGVVSGLTAAAYRWALAEAERLRAAWFAVASTLPGPGWAWAALFGAVVAGGAVLLTSRLAPEATGSGIPHLKSVLHGYRQLRSMRLLIVKFVGGLLAAASGMALGREGPSIQIAGAASELAGQALRLNEQDRRTLIAAGAGGGLAAAFNTPLAGMMFVLEEIRRDFEPIVFGAAFIAAITATAISQVLYGQAHSFDAAAFTAPPLPTLASFGFLGMLCGFFGVAYNRTLLSVQSGMASLSRRIGSPVWIGAAAGAVISIVAWNRPDIVGGGHAIAETALHAGYVLSAIPLLLVARFAMNTISYGTGAPGGIFAPLLGLGALTGLALGLLLQRFLPALAVEPGAFAVVGMAALFTAIVRAPLTGIVLIIEMTGGGELMLALAVACFTAYVVAEALGDMPIYEALLMRSLQQTPIQEVR